MIADEHLLKGSPGSGFDAGADGVKIVRLPIWQKRDPKPSQHRYAIHEHEHELEQLFAYHKQRVRTT